jgi:hypothetical protein
MPRIVAPDQNPHSYALLASAGPFEHHRKRIPVSEEDDEVTVGVEALQRGLPSEPAEAGFVESDSHPQEPNASGCAA